MHRVTDDLARRALPVPAADRTGRPTLTRDDVVTLVRRRVDVDAKAVTDGAGEAWWLWRVEVGKADQDATNHDVLQRVVERVRAGD